jgi:hypothetical protein
MNMALTMIMAHANDFCQVTPTAISVVAGPACVRFQLRRGGGKRSSTSCWWLLSTLRSCSMLHPPRCTVFVCCVGVMVPKLAGELTDTSCSHNEKMKKKDLASV